MFKLPRMWHWILATALLLFGIYLLSPQQLPVVMYKVAMVALFAVLGYWIDRSLFPYARPHEFVHGGSGAFDDMPYAASMIRRALIILAVILSGSIGL